ncbi:MAG TPA: formylglycine-generating enzyme family protein [Pirellulales bacterium]|jgi:formylglycine-generating enzyme required for sulfatase activity|nr:formylglycine-generating enzyme family protein [Pirellulales bacterium]
MRFVSRSVVAMMVFAIGSHVVWSADRAKPEPASPGAVAVRDDTSNIRAAAETITNSIGLKLIKIPAGEFMMGSHESLDEMKKTFTQYEPRRFNHTDEYPVHRVRITRPFYMGIYSVTRGQFQQFVNETNYKTDAERNDPSLDTPGDSRRTGPGGYGYNKETGKLDAERNPKHTWRDPGFPQTDVHPVVDVSWNDAVAFCKWLSEKEAKGLSENRRGLSPFLERAPSPDGREKKGTVPLSAGGSRIGPMTYRLPTEAEWEYACRAGTTTRYWSGDDPESLVKIANTYDQSSARVFPEWSKFALKGDDGFAFTAPVGSFQPNPFGLYDMHGNVWQWCSDWYAEDYYAKSPVDDPQGPPPARQHVRRGGAWHSWAMYVRSAFRNYNTPQSRYFNLGFRVVGEGLGARG